MAKEQTQEETTTPRTFAELRELSPVLKELPELAEPGKLTPVQSADFSVLELVAQKGLEKMRDNVEDDVRAAMEISRIIAVADEFCSSIAADKDEYAAWAKGRPVTDLFDAYLNIIAFYRVELGKFAASSTPTNSAE